MNIAWRRPCSLSSRAPARRAGQRYRAASRTTVRLTIWLTARPAARPAAPARACSSLVGSFRFVDCERKRQRRRDRKQYDQCRKPLCGWLHPSGHSTSELRRCERAILAKSSAAPSNGPGRYQTRGTKAPLCSRSPVAGAVPTMGACVPTGWAGEPAPTMPVRPARAPGATTKLGFRNHRIADDRLWRKRDRLDGIRRNAKPHGQTKGNNIAHRDLR